MKQQIIRLGSHSVIYGVGTMLTRFLSLLLLPLFTTYLTPADYGVISLLGLLSFVAQPIFSLGLGAAMGPSYFEGNNEKRKSATVWTAFLILLVSSVILLSLAWLFPLELSWLALQSTDYANLVSLSLTGVAINILSTPFTQILQFEERSKLFVGITLFTSFISIIINVTTVVFFKWGVYGVVISQVWGNTIHFLAFVCFAIRSLKVSYSNKIAQDLLNMGIPLVPSFAFLFILMQSNRYILQWIEGLEQVGAYSIGFNIGAVMNVLVGAFTTAWYPFFMSYIDKQEEGFKVFEKVLKYYVILFGVITLCFFVFARPLLLLLTTPEFHVAYKVIGFCALSQFFIGLFSIFTPNLYFTREVRYVSLFQGFASVISIPINILLINNFGLFGAGLGLASSTSLLPIFQCIWNYYRYNKKSKAIEREILYTIILSAVIIPFSLIPFNQSFLGSITQSLILFGIIIYFVIHYLITEEFNLLIKLFERH